MPGHVVVDGTGHLELGAGAIDDPEMRPCLVGLDEGRALQDGQYAADVLQTGLPDLDVAVTVGAGDAAGPAADDPGLHQADRVIYGDNGLEDSRRGICG